MVRTGRMAEGAKRWLFVLIASILICGYSFYRDRASGAEDPQWLAAGYAISFGLALVWSLLNYVSRIRLNNLYRKHSGIEAYVDQLAMSEDDKLELRNYLEDFAQDLASQGRTQQEAEAEALSHFRIKEWMSASDRSSLFSFQSHSYLWIWAAGAYVLAVVLAIADIVFKLDTVWTLIVTTLLAAYGTAWIALVYVYKLADAWIERQWRNHFS